MQPVLDGVVVQQIKQVTLSVLPLSVGSSRCLGLSSPSNCLESTANFGSDMEASRNVFRVRASHELVFVRVPPESYGRQFELHLRRDVCHLGDLESAVGRSSLVGTGTCDVQQLLHGDVLLAQLDRFYHGFLFGNSPRSGKTNDGFRESRVESRKIHLF